MAKITDHKVGPNAYITDSTSPRAWTITGSGWKDCISCGRSTLGTNGLAVCWKCLDNGYTVSGKETE